MNKPEIFLSYAWGGESEKIVNELDAAFQEKGITLIRDKRDLGFKGMITDFMVRIGEGNAVVTVISDKYLKSPYCMFELLEIYRNLNFKERIFPIVLDDANVFDPLPRLQYLKHWQDKKKELDDAIMQFGTDAITIIGDDYKIYKKIFDNFGEVVNILKEINSLTPDMHRKDNFGILIDTVSDTLATKKRTGTDSNKNDEGQTIKFNSDMELRLNLKRIEKYLKQFDYFEIDALFNDDILSTYKGTLNMFNVDTKRQSAIDCFRLKFQSNQRIVLLLKALWSFAKEKDLEEGFGQKAEYVLVKDSSGNEFMAESLPDATNTIQNFQIDTILNEVLQKLNNLETKNDTILETVTAFKQKLEEKLPQIDGITEKVIEIGKNYPQEVNNEVLTLLNQIKQDQIPKNELEEFFGAIGTEIDKIKDNELTDIWKKINESTSPLNSKVELALPILPGLLTFKHEIKANKPFENLAKKSRKFIF